PALATTVRALPSGWGIVAVESAGRGQWWAAAGLLLALAALIGLLFLAWARTLGRPRRSRGVAGPRRLRGVAGGQRLHGVAGARRSRGVVDAQRSNGIAGPRRIVDAERGGTTGAVVVKEL